MYVYGPWMHQKRASDLSGTGVIGGCELLNMAVRNQIQVLWNKGKHSQP